MTAIILTFLFVSLFLIFSGFVSMLGKWIRYFYFGIGAGTTSIALDKFEPLWLVIVCLVITIIIAFAMFNLSEKNKDDSFVIPDRISTNMSAYFTGVIGGVIWSLLT